MSLSPITEIYAVSDCKVAPITADPVGGSTTYGALVDVPGIENVTVTGQVNVKELRGDNQVLDRRKTLDYLQVKLDFSKFSFDIYAALIGGTVTDSGTTPSQKKVWDYSGQDAGYFKVEATCVGVDSSTGDGHLTLWRCNVVNFPAVGFKGEDFQTFSIEASAYRRNSDQKLMAWTLNETAAAIA